MRKHVPFQIFYHSLWEISITFDKLIKTSIEHFTTACNKLIHQLNQREQNSLVRQHANQTYTHVTLIKRPHHIHKAIDIKDKPLQAVL